MRLRRPRSSLRSYLEAPPVCDCNDDTKYDQYLTSLSILERSTSSVVAEPYRLLPAPIVSSFGLWHDHTAQCCLQLFNTSVLSTSSLLTLDQHSSLHYPSRHAPRYPIIRPTSCIETLPYRTLIPLTTPLPLSLKMLPTRRSGIGSPAHHLRQRLKQMPQVLHHQIRNTRSHILVFTGHEA